MNRPEAKSFKQLTISVEKLPALMAQEAATSSYAADRARLLLGCYRTGDANDPETYVAAIAAILSRYPQHVITSVTHPATGLPSQKNWLPTVKEVTDACEELIEFSRNQTARENRIVEQLRLRAEEDASAHTKPTLEQLRTKYGENWGLTPIPKAAPNPDADLKMKQRTERMQLREYAAAGIEPRYTSDGMLISLSLARLINP